MNRVAVLMGGPSAEREVSLNSGAAVAGALRERGYEVQSIDVGDVLPALPASLDGVFIALHGTYGEDGQIQQALDDIGMPYTGTGAAASRVAFDKGLCQACLAAAGVPTAPSELLARGQSPALPLPLVVKPCRQGSSIGISYVRTDDELAPALALAFQFDDRVLAEAYIPGRELTVGVVEGLVYLVSSDESFHAKYG